MKKREKNWTVGPSGRANDSPAFHQIVKDVARTLSSHRLGGNVEDTARVIVARLAHLYDMRPVSENG